METLTKDQFMSLVYKDFENKEKKKLIKEKKVNDDYRAYKIEQSNKFGSKYTKRKNVRR